MTRCCAVGSTRAGADGRAQFEGELAWRDALPYGQLHLSGENLRVVNIPEARVQASPDVRMKFAGHRIDVSGTVSLPYARLQRPDQLTNAVRASGDEVIVSANQAPPRAQFHVFSDLTLQLGERVTIDTLGLAGRLSGSLRTVADDTGFNRGSGELQVEEGKYTAYGRKLDIERGRLQFRNGPLNDPAIDLRAIKKFPDITAGVNVRGTLRAPRMTFFSDPAVSQSQIVSLLIAGGSLESVQNNTDPGATQQRGAQQHAAAGQRAAVPAVWRQGRASMTSASNPASTTTLRWCWAATSRRACTSATASASPRRSTPSRCATPSAITGRSRPRPAPRAARTWSTRSSARGAALREHSLDAAVGHQPDHGHRGVQQARTATAARTPTAIATA